jgi:hypothetical protein
MAGESMRAKEAKVDLQKVMPRHVFMNVIGWELKGKEKSGPWATRSETPWENEMPITRS